MSAYRFSGYWKDVGTLDSLWDANMDMLAQNSGLNLLEKSWPIYAGDTPEPPAYFGENAQTEHCVFARGCRINGSVRESVLSQSCVVSEGAEVEYSILMPGVVVEKGAKVSYAIVGENSCIGAGAVIGGSPEQSESENWGIAVVGPEAEVPSGYRLAPNHMLNHALEEVVR